MKDTKSEAPRIGDSAIRIRSWGRFKVGTVIVLAVAAALSIAGINSMAAPAADKSQAAGKLPAPAVTATKAVPRADLADVTSVGSSSLLVLSRERDWVAVFGPKRGEWSVYHAPNGVTLSYVVSAEDVVIGLVFCGPSISEIAAYCPGINAWSRQQLPKPWHGNIDPLISGGVIEYVVGSQVYAVAAKRGVWDVLDTAGEKINNRFGTGAMGGLGAIPPEPVTVHYGNRLAAFGPDDTRWSILDLRTGSLVVK